MSGSSHSATCEEMFTTTTSVAVGAVFTPTLLAYNTESEMCTIWCSTCAVVRTFVDIELSLVFVLTLGEASSFVVDTETVEGGCIPALQVRLDTVVVLGWAVVLIL